MTVEERNKILIVDDDRNLTSAASEFLEGKNFQTRVANDPNQVVKQVKEDPPDLILLDYRMPLTSGLEVLKAVRGLDRDVAVVLMTGYGSEHLVVDFMRQGADDYLKKPFSLSELARVVEKNIGYREQRLALRQNEKFLLWGRMFPRIAHEIKNPLHSLGGAVAVLKGKFDKYRGRFDRNDAQVLDQTVAIIREEIDRLTKFINNSLELSRTSSRLLLIDMNLNEVIQTCLNFMRPSLKQAGVKVSLKLEPKLPLITANYDELKQLFLNLINNALEAMPKGGRLTIGTTHEPEQQEVTVGITDTGPGFKEEEFENLFTPFYTSKSKGVGMGLAISKKIVEEHGGHIKVSNRKRAAGARIEISFPISQSSV